MQRTVSFGGLPFSDVDTVSSDTVAAVVGAGYSLGSAHTGTENAPFFLRTLSKAYTWSSEQPTIIDIGHRRTMLDGVVDLGDLVFDGLTLAEAQTLVTATLRSLPAGVAPCVIGGDHTVTLGVVDALLARCPAPMRVIQFDHHLDLQLWGSAPGRPELREPLFNTNVMSHVDDRIGPGRLVQVGVAPFTTVDADAASAALAYLRSVGTQVCLTAAELDNDAEFVDLVGRGHDVYVTVDVDVLERGAMTATGYPAEVGLAPRRLLRLIDLVLAHNRLVGADVVEFAAARDDRDPRTLADGGRAVTILLHLLRGMSRRQARTEC